MTALTALGLALPALAHRGWWLWTALVTAGAVALAGALAMGLGSLALWGWSRLRAPQRRTGRPGTGMGA